MNNLVVDLIIMEGYISIASTASLERHKGSQLNLSRISNLWMYLSALHPDSKIP